MTAHIQRGEIESLVANLVQIETENPPGNEQACSEFIVDWFDDRGVNADLVSEPYADRPQVGARAAHARRGATAPRTCFTPWVAKQMYAANLLSSLLCKSIHQVPTNPL